MAQKKETVYLKADRNIEVEKRAVTLGDVLKIESVNPILLAKLKAIRLLKFQKESSEEARASGGVDSEGH